MPMPATAGGIPPPTGFVGVDGCRAGWVAVSWRPHERAASVAIHADFRTLLAATRTAGMVIVDMPIGLADDGRRACERLARQILGRRSSCVFAAPRRPMLAFATYDEANGWGRSRGVERGGGLSKQAWNILPKIREIDAAITPADQMRLGEGHPEIAFSRLAGGGACRRSKHTPEGAAERTAILDHWKFPDPRVLIAEAKSLAGSGVKPDDVIDACALALTAEARAAGAALRLSDDARDARGLLMEIWG